MTDLTNSTRYYSFAGQNTRLYKNSVYNHLRKLINDMDKMKRNRNSCEKENIYSTKIQLNIHK